MTDGAMEQLPLPTSLAEVEAVSDQRAGDGRQARKGRETEGKEDGETEEWEGQKS
jgi:hypothetical protein